MPDIVYYVQNGVIIALVIYSIILHEIAHAYAAFRLGDPTAAMQGRLTLNPVKHVDPFATILMPVMLYYFTEGRYVLGSAKPVPINPFNFRNPRKGMLISGIAGPLVNLIIMLLCAGIVRLLYVLPWVSSRFLVIFFHVGLINFLLVVFNLLPVPPLDGSRVVSYFLPRHLQDSYEKLERFGLLPVFLIIVVFERQLDWLYLHASTLYRHLAGAT